MKISNYVRIENHVLKLGNLGKILYPASHFSKGDVFKYYQAIAPFVLPHLYNRPFTLRRFPDGVDRPSFFEKTCPSFRPTWMKTGEFDSVNFCLVNDWASLAWVLNLAALELHTTLGTIEDPNCPTFMVFDLDPGKGVEFLEIARVAIALRDLLQNECSLASYVKTSGVKGLHIAVPINTPATFVQTKEFARRIARRMERRIHHNVVSSMSKNLRPGHVFIDWSQNSHFKTTCTVYSLRAVATPTVSTPVTWSELENAKGSLRFSPDKVLRRMEKYGDLFEPVLKKKQDLVAKDFDDPD